MVLASRPPGWSELGWVRAVLKEEKTDNPFEKLA
jgi:hypothetical protein